VREIALQSRDAWERFSARGISARYFFAATLVCCPCLAQTSQVPEIVTDRPDITESSVVIPLGSIQAENGFTWTRDHRTSALDVPESLIRLGLWERTELRFTAPNYLDRTGAPYRLSGLGDTSIGIKEQLGPLPGAFEVAVIVALSVPTGARRVSNRGFDPFVKIPWSRDLIKGWSVGGMQSIFYQTDSGRRRLIWEPTFYVEREIGKRSDVFVESSGDYCRATSSRQLIHLGTAYRITARHQVDFHFGFGLTHTTPSQFVAVGYSLRVDHLLRLRSR
jgi:Putative MetA-pathway of phenol degradation